jgi:hypothetical protein
MKIPWGTDIMPGNCGLEASAPWVFSYFGAANLQARYNSDALAGTSMERNRKINGSKA